eukprot:TRINITY_DN5502_c0_g1_i1.p1 TRINITY_DN5502_c0_g1~~TRINITY_DN5502_c0_g1_i1.p1  ORF type:complete len:335 (+),score=50.29 TRINITY_DN5502_c0_g1_i1:35-1006(+)
MQRRGSSAMGRYLQPVLLLCLAVSCCWWLARGREAHLDVRREDRGSGQSVLARLDAVVPSLYVERDGQNTAVLGASWLALGVTLRPALAAAGGMLFEKLLSGGHRHCRAPAEQNSEKARQQPLLLAAAVLSAFLVGLCVPVLLALVRRLRCRRRTCARSLPSAAGDRGLLPKVVAPHPLGHLQEGAELLSSPRFAALPTPVRNAAQSHQSPRSASATSPGRSRGPLAAEEDVASPPLSPTFSEDRWNAAESSHDGGSDSEDGHRVLEATQVRRSFPLSRNEKQLRLCQVLDQERQAALQESRRLRGAASDAAQRLLAAAADGN